MRNQRFGVLACVLAAVLCTACGGGGGGGDGGSTDLGGWWDVAGRPHGGTKGYEPFIIIQAAHTGSSFWVNGSEFIQTGNELLSIEPSASDPDREVISLTIMNADLLEGTMERYESDALVETNDLRVSRRATAPSGSFTVSGTIDSTPVAVTSGTAYGALEEDVSDSEFGIYHVTPYESETRLEVEAEESPLQAREYTVGSGPGTITAEIDVGEDGAQALGGTVTLTTVGVRLVGTYDLTWPGGSAAGSFDVDVLLPRLP